MYIHFEHANVRLMRMRAGDNLINYRFLLLNRNEIDIERKSLKLSNFNQ
jgi:hypothetical protein